MDQRRSGRRSGAFAAAAARRRAARHASTSCCAARSSRRRLVDAASAHLARLGAISRPTGGARGGRGARGTAPTCCARLGFVDQRTLIRVFCIPGAWATPIGRRCSRRWSRSALCSAARAQSARLTRASRCVLVVGFGALAYLGRRGVLDFPLMRRRGVNLQATRGGWRADRVARGAPRLEVAAGVDDRASRRRRRYLDRLVVVLALIVTFVDGVARRLALAVAGRSPGSAPLPLMLSVVGDRNHGTLDNASGVAAVLEAAASIPAHGARRRADHRRRGARAGRCARVGARRARRRSRSTATASTTTGRSR